MSGRNLIDYSQKLFNLLSKDLPVSNVNKMRLLPNPNIAELAKEKDVFLKSSAVEVDYILNNVKVAKFSYDNDEYLAITQLHRTESASPAIFKELESSGILYQEIHAGFFLCLVTDADLQRRTDVSLNDLEDKIFYDQYDGDYLGHNFKDLIEFIENFTIFKIDTNSVFTGRDSTEASYFICAHFKKFIRLPFVDHLVNDFRIMLEEPSPILKENVFLSLTATHFKHAFLELYRCVEMLYIIPRSIQLKAKLGYQNQAYELAKHCSNELGWRRREEDSLIRIFKDIQESVIAASGISQASFADASWTFDGTDATKNSQDSLAKKIYKIRNQLVHQIFPDDEIDISDLDWGILMKFTLDIIKDAYQIYKSELPIKFS